MSDLAALIADMVRAGVDADLIGRTASMVASASKAADQQAERRRAADRERKARLRKSAESAESADPSSSPEVSPHTPFPNPNTIPPSPPKGGSSPTGKRAERLPEGWVLPEDWRQDAIDAGLPEPRIASEAQKLVDWSRSSPNGAKRDWRAAWRNWCRRVAAEVPPMARGSPQRAPSQADVFRMIAKRSADEPQRDDSPIPRPAIPHLSAVGSGR